MSKKTSDINKVTGTVISVSLKLIIYVLIILLLYQGVTKGYQFGYQIFNASAVSNPPGIDKEVYIQNESVEDAARLLKRKGLIDNEFIFSIQAKFYDYEIHSGKYTFNTSQTPKEMLQMMNEVEPESEDDKS